MPGIIIKIAMEQMWLNWAQLKISMMHSIVKQQVESIMTHLLKPNKIKNTVFYGTPVLVAFSREEGLNGIHNGLRMISHYDERKLLTIILRH